MNSHIKSLHLCFQCQLENWKSGSRCNTGLQSSFQLSTIRDSELGIHTCISQKTVPQKMTDNHLKLCSFTTMFIGDLAEWDRRNKKILTEKPGRINPETQDLPMISFPLFVLYNFKIIQKWTWVRLHFISSNSLTLFVSMINNSAAIFFLFPFFKFHLFPHKENTQFPNLVIQLQQSKL